MKIVKNLTVTVSTMSFYFAGIGFHMATNYSNMDEVTRCRYIIWCNIWFK